MDPFGALVLAGVAAGVVACVLRPAWAAPVFAFLIYARVSDSLRGEYGIPSLFMFLAPAAIVLALVQRFAFGERAGRGWAGATWWLAAWGSVGLASFLHARDASLTADTLLNFLDGALIVCVMTAFLRDGRDLERVVWALLGAGLFLGSLTLHQRLFGNFDATYAGFARVEMRNLLGSTSGLRSEGPVSANYFALVLVPLVPLAVDRLLHARARAGRWVAGLALVAVVGAIGSTFSRGGFLALAAVSGLMLLQVPRWPRIAAAALPVGLALLWLLPASYVDRMATFGQVWDGLRGRHVEDNAIRGRISEVQSAAMMFGDHPFFGVGVGNFELYYPSYAFRVGLDEFDEGRQAHSLYLEVAAETGLVGLAVFGGLLVYAGLGIQRARNAFREAGEETAYQLVTAFGIGFAGYLFGSVFLHLSYPRFFWLLLGVALAVRGLTEARQREAPSWSGEEAWA